MAKKGKNVIAGSVDKNISAKADGSDTSKELKETLNKVPELEKRYYRLPSLSQKQKKKMEIGETIDGWEKMKQDFFIENKNGSIILLKKEIAGEKEGGIVREYLDGVPEEFRNFQMFTPEAAHNLGLDDMLPAGENLLALIGERSVGDSDEVYEKNNTLIKKFIQDNKLSKVGYFSANYNCPVYMNGFRHALLLKDDKHAEIDDNRDDIERYKNSADKHHGYPIMLMKK